MNLSLGAAGTHLCWAAAPLFQAAWELWDSGRGGGAGAESWKERESSRAQKMGVLLLFPQKNHLLQAFLFFAEEASQGLTTSVFLAVTFRAINSVQQKRQEKTRIGHHQTQQNPGTAPSPQPPAAAGRQKPPEPWRVAGKESLGKINSHQAEL